MTCPLDHDRLGLRDRRRRLRGLRARQPAVRRRPPFACCCSRRARATRYPWIHVPIGYAKTMFHPVDNWRFKTEPEPGMNGREIYWPRGRTLGGSSAINGLIYIRGQRDDYDHWAALGNRGLELRRRAPVLSQARAQRPRRERVARRRRPALGIRHRCEARARRGDDRRRRGARHSAQRRLQRRARRKASAITSSRRAAAFAARPRSRTCARRAAAPNLAVETNAHATRIVLDGRRATRRRLSPGRARHTVDARGAK